MSTQPLAEAEILEQAIRLAPPSKRNAYLDDACGGDRTLRERLDGLIKGLESYGAILDRPAANALVEATEAFPFEAPEEAAGTLIDRYKLLEKIGEGGFGTVYLAEQQEPVVRKVALKLIKAGMDTRQVVARFESERQALALMEHPNIARVLDGGATDSGRPYFVMELVSGAPITDYCHENSLTVRERIELFLRVCQAVQHAHQKGIIHRDLKPSNVMVSLDEPADAAIPKVIDFGVSKAISQRLTGHTFVTNQAQGIGTPAYMSPEQTGMDGLGTDTRSDIYSLGVLLYELLTGTTPHDSKRLARVSSAEMERIIREEDPPRPSARLRAIGADQAALGDLDWVVMKTLEKDPQRRYETVSALAEDLRRHLAHEPVSAAAPSLTYRLGKFVRRHQVGTFASTAVAIAILTGLGISTWLFLREREARQEADQIAIALTGILEDFRVATSHGRTSTDLVTAVDRTDERIDSIAASRPDMVADLRETLGLICHTMGDYDRAEKLLGKVLAARRRLYGNDDPRLVNILLDYALVAGEALGGEKAVLPLNEEAYELSKRHHGVRHPDTIAAMSRLIVSYSLVGRWPESLALHDIALVAANDVRGPKHAQTLRLRGNIAGSYRFAGDAGRSVHEFEQLVPAMAECFGPRDPHTLDTIWELSNSLEAAGRHEEALAQRLTVHEFAAHVYGFYAPKRIRAMKDLARSYERTGETDAASDLRRLIDELLSEERNRPSPFDIREHPRARDAGIP